MRANVIVPLPSRVQSNTGGSKRVGRRMSPVNNPGLGGNKMVRTVPKSTGKDICSILEDANTVLECMYSDHDIVFVRILNGYGQRVYVLVDQNGINVDNKMYHKDCTIEKNALYTEKLFETYATLCNDNDIGCAVEHEDKIFISLCGNTYLIHTLDSVLVPTYYPASSMRKILTPKLFNSSTSYIYSRMRSLDSDRITLLVDNLYDCSDSISKTIDNIGCKHSQIVEKLFKRMTKDSKTRDEVVDKDMIKYMDVVSSLKQNNETVIQINTMTDITGIYAELNTIKTRLNEVLDNLSDYMK